MTQAKTYQDSLSNRATAIACGSVVSVGEPDASVEIAVRRGVSRLLSAGAAFREMTDCLSPFVFAVSLCLCGEEVVGGYERHLLAYNGHVSETKPFRLTESVKAAG